MDYFDAVKEGRKRASLAVSLLQEVAGPCHPMLFLKLGVPDWTPVGKAMLHTVVPGRNETAAVVVCDREGNAKAMSAFVSEDRAREFGRSLELRGVPVFPGDVKLPI